MSPGELNLAVKAKSNTTRMNRKESMASVKTEQRKLSLTRPSSEKSLFPSAQKKKVISSCQQSNPPRCEKPPVTPVITNSGVKSCHKCNNADLSNMIECLQCCRNFHAKCESLNMEELAFLNDMKKM